MMMDLYTETCFECSKVITNKYSTSFSMGIRAFEANLRYPIYAIYGFVRYADEIVDTFHDHDKATLIAAFRKDTFEAIKRKISLNPVLHSFQHVVNRYAIDIELIDAFLQSMEMDLDKTSYTVEGYETYIYGSAEVVGLMCLKVFCDGDDILYAQLVPQARSLGAAFQKVNFLRDIKADLEDKGRTYFPEVDMKCFSERDKRLIEESIQKDFDDALSGIKKLPSSARKGVYIAYVYYLELFKKIRQLPVNTIAEGRVRVSDLRKIWLLAHALVNDI